MNRELRFTRSAEAALRELERDEHRTGLLKQVHKTLCLLETDLRHPSLRTHEFQALRGPNGEKVFEAYVQSRTPEAQGRFERSEIPLLPNGASRRL